MKFLVDECLHTSLVELLNDAGFEAHHVVRLGMQGFKDHEVMKRVQEDEFVFVTNNASDFRDLHSRENLHPGLIIIVPNVKPVTQQALCMAGLRHIGTRLDLINKVIEIRLDDGDIVIGEYDHPRIEI